ncbi:hypothetical protein G7011_00380 [Pseudomonas plecoglossicida]|uniref:hypothetical protein n=1 Tax=Pseudomonas plecoglossicida TaxID=70775 RepID=UPI0015E42C4F|nr:hypothetical protein [Pseudomonas plecoglossicida]MBA1195569.1 hypothetical protein [Pseudomonas plecoglossicida]
MRSVNKTKTIHYKNCFITGDVVLQEAIRKSLAKEGPTGKPFNRQQKINSDDDTVIFINRTSEFNGMTFCQLVVLESGKKQPYITVDDDAEFYSIDALASEKIPDAPAASNTKVQAEETTEEKARKRREFLESILYFGVIGNHAVVLQSSSLRSRELEAHLSWLLGTCTSNIPNDAMLVLKDKPAESVYQKLRSKPVKSIKLGAPLSQDASNDPSAPKDLQYEVTENDEVHANKVRFVPQGLGASLLRAALPEGFLEKLDLDESLDDANIHVALEITYLRKTTTIGQRVIDSVATSLRHLPESDVVINLQGGGKISGDELKLSGGISVKFMENGLIDESVLFHEMHKWLLGKISSSEIDTSAEAG